MSERPKFYDGSQRPYDGSPRPPAPPAPPSSSRLPRLPRVSPEDLVEGKWYVVKDDDGYRHHVYCVFDPDGEPGLYTLDILYESGFGLNRIAIWGPIDYELEEA